MKGTTKNRKGIAMRSIKKTIKTTHVAAYAVNADTMTVELVGTFDVIGGLGERLCKSEARRRFGNVDLIKVNDTYGIYTMDGETFIANATYVGEGNSEDYEQ